ncbi:MAG: dihydrofolate reductase family protein [Thermoplasmatales archaeon]|jgi:dihydrofolate reductase|nr:dihydrofolate reductase family protein [Candidatus Thermoplasmatota archaeon]MCL6002589.1 dihydrofolate reductase family protein [Candidatus Thermoplasmatota archaeon]MDA8054875.1 dihydrofolate reductase family protein [Thermoplasmatales archaeon]
MRRVVLDSLMSLDGYYTDSKNQIEWFLPFEEEDLAWSHDILTSAGLLVFGRTTYEEFSKFFPKLDAAATGWDPYVVERLNNLPKLVFSTTLKEGEWKPSNIVRTDPAQEISRLKKGTGKEIEIIGSGSIAAAIVRAGLVDEYRIRVQPILLGSGKHLFENQGELRRLRLVEARSFKSGVTALHYVPQRE